MATKLASLVARVIRDSVGETRPEPWTVRLTLSDLGHLREIALQNGWTRSQAGNYAFLIGLQVLDEVYQVKEVA